MTLPLSALRPSNGDGIDADKVVAVTAPFWGAEMPATRLGAGTRGKGSVVHHV